MLKRFIFVLLVLFTSIHSEETELVEGRSLRIYKTDTWELVTDLPSNFGILFAEYSENFSRLVLDFFNEVKEEKSLLKGKVYLFQSCQDYSLFLNQRGIKNKNLLYFTNVSPSDFSQVEIAGCTTTTGHLYMDFQKTVVRAFLKNKGDKYPEWLKSGFENYFSYSSYIADDLSVQPYKNFDYINIIHRFEKKHKKHIGINDLFRAEKTVWKKNKSAYRAYSWALVTYLMDGNYVGREFIKEYYKNIESKKNELFRVPEKTGNSSISEEEWFEWLKKLPFPRGLEHYQKAQRQNTHSSRKESLSLAVEEFPDYWFYQRELAREYYANDIFSPALDFGERALQLKLNSRLTLETLIISSYRLGQYPKTEFYLWVCDQFGYCKNKYNQEREMMMQYRRNNPEAGKFKPLLITPGGWF